ncbi:MAG TPA: protein kinase, partial [Myxococcota bacterium]|nr:protein kinase [Myxococcota bacterium]
MTRQPADDARRDPSCPGCAAVFPQLHDLQGGAWICVACGAAITSTGSAPRWLYPRWPAEGSLEEPEREITWATLDTPGPAGEAERAPRRVGRYELRRLLGHGGMGVVYEAWDTEIHRRVALKMLTAGAFASPAARQRFVAEARAAGNLDHPGVVRVLDLGAQEQQLFFTMEL